MRVSSIENTVFGSMETNLSRMFAWNLTVAWHGWLNAENRDKKDGEQILQSKPSTQVYCCMKIKLLTKCRESIIDSFRRVTRWGSRFDNEYIISGSLIAN